MPPSEWEPKGCSAPYGTDYVSWAQAIAKQPLSYPILTGWVIDDFAQGANLKTVTPAYTKRVHDQGAAPNPTCCS